MLSGSVEPLSNPADASLAETAVSLGLDLLPVVGDVKGIAEAITGRDLVTGEEIPAWQRVLGAIPLINDGAKLLARGADIRRAIEGGRQASRAAEAVGDRSRAVEVADLIGDSVAVNRRRLEAAQATGDADLIAEAQDDVADAQAAYQDALAAVERACFVAGTLILTPTGMRAIESLQVGETVLAGVWIAKLSQSAK